MMLKTLQIRPSATHQSFPSSNNESDQPARLAHDRHKNRKKRTKKRSRNPTKPTTTILKRSSQSSRNLPPASKGRLCNSELNNDPEPPARPLRSIRRPEQTLSETVQ